MNTEELDNLGSGEVSAEILWRGNKSIGTEDWDMGIKQEKDNFPPTFYGSGRINPTQNLVDAFPMANGYPIADKANSGYSENAPYTGRDPRLEKYILFNGAEFKDKTIITGLYLMRIINKIMVESIEYLHVRVIICVSCYVRIVTLTRIR